MKTPSKQVLVISSYNSIWREEERFEVGDIQVNTIAVGSPDPLKCSSTIHAIAIMAVCALFYYSCTCKNFNNTIH